jgi:hypothetical protein
VLNAQALGCQVKVSANNQTLIIRLRQFAWNVDSKSARKRLTLRPFTLRFGRLAKSVEGVRIDSTHGKFEHRNLFSQAFLKEQNVS